jgi:hypothetical protein
MAEDKNRPKGLYQNEVIITRLEETPVTIKGLAWIPVSQVLAWSLFSWISRKRHPGRSGLRASLEGFLQMAVSLGSEWGHNLAHLSISNWIGQPMDEFRIQLGMPRCLYQHINDRDVSPEQHILRALGGPIFNLLVLPFAAAAARLTRKGSLVGTTARTALATNLFLSLVSLLPIPGIDGGPILKWSLVKRGSSVPEADEIVRKVNGPLAVILGLFSSWSFGKKNHLVGFFSAMLGATSLGIAAGWIKEEELNS